MHVLFSLAEKGYSFFRGDEHEYLAFWTFEYGNDDENARVSN